jgi:hypothetical protein
MGNRITDNSKERSLPIVLMIDKGLAADRRALAEWLSNSRFSSCDAVDIFEAIGEMADFTVQKRPDVIVLDCEPCRENIDLVQSVFQSEVIKLSKKGDLSAVVERLDTLIPATVTTH